MIKISKPNDLRQSSFWPEAGPLRAFFDRAAKSAKKPFAALFFWGFLPQNPKKLYFLLQCKP